MGAERTRGEGKCLDKMTNVLIFWFRLITSEEGFQSHLGSASEWWEKG